MTALNNYAVIEGGFGRTTGALSQGGDGIANSGTITILNNFDNGEIVGVRDGAAFGFGASNSGTITTLTNRGHISGFAGVWNTKNIAVINNLSSGVIQGSFAGIWSEYQVISINNSPGGVIDPALGGYAILSTGSIGSITNGGKIIGNVEIDNQESLTVFGGTERTFGQWTGGTITIGNGDLAFARGNTALGDNIVVDGGRGTIFNNDPLMASSTLSSPRRNSGRSRSRAPTPARRSLADWTSS
jgi:hypothetical protein